MSVYEKETHRTALFYPLLVAKAFQTSLLGDASSQRKPISSHFYLQYENVLDPKLQSREVSSMSRYNMHVISEMAEYETSRIWIGFKRRSISSK